MPLNTSCYYYCCHCYCEEAENWTEIVLQLVGSGVWKEGRGEGGRIIMERRNIAHAAIHCLSEGSTGRAREVELCHILVFLYIDLTNCMQTNRPIAILPSYAFIDAKSPMSFPTSHCVCVYV